MATAPKETTLTVWNSDAPMQTVGLAVGVGGLCVLILVLVVCVYKKRRPANMATTRGHQKLCAVDSGMVSVPVQRVAGTPTQVRGHESLPVDFLQDINRNSPNRSDSPGRASGITHNPSFRNSPSFRDAPNRASSFRNSPSLRNEAQRGDSFRNSPSIRDDSKRSQIQVRNSPSCREKSPLVKDRSTYIASDKSRNSNSRESTPRRDGMTQRLLSVESHEDFPANLPPEPANNMDGFMTCSSFDMKLHDEPTAGSKASSYDNLEPTPEIDRKGSLYDNVDEKPAAAPAFDISKLNAAGMTTAKETPSSTRRRASTTLPLHFSLFKGHRLTNTTPTEDPDYANVTPTEDPDYANLTSDVAAVTGQPGNRYSVTTKSPDEPPIPTKRKQRYRRGSQTLTLYCNKKLMPPVLSRIEQQVLKYVPIYGEPTPGTTPRSPAFEVLQFPPPPLTTPPRTPQGSQLLSYINPTYSPTTAGTMTSEEYRGNAYFSI